MKKKGWERKTLGEVCSFHRGLTYSKKDEVDYSSNAVLRSNNVDPINYILNLDEIRYINDSINIPINKKVEKGSILICTANGSKSHLGKIALIDNEYDFAFGGFMGLLKPNEKIHSKYLYYSMVSSMYRDYINELSDGVNINNLKFNDLSMFPILVAPLKEQEEIVKKLDKGFELIDRLKENAEKNLENAKELFQSALREELSPKKGWETKKLGEVAKIVKEQGMHKGLPYIGMEDIESKSLKFTGSREAKEMLSNTFRFDNDVILFGRLRPYLCKIYEPDFVGHCSSEIFPLRTFNNLEKSFLKYWLFQEDIIEEINKTCTGARMPRANMNYVLDFDISFPSLKEQQAIVTKLDKIKAMCEELEENYKKSLVLCEDLKQGLLREVFEG